MKLIVVTGSGSEEINCHELGSYIVGRERAATKAVLVDIGASINLHGSLWLKGLESEVLIPNNLAYTSSPGRASIGGVGKGQQRSSQLRHVPSAILAQDRWGRKVVIYATFHSHEIEGGTPALWWLAS